MRIILYISILLFTGLSATSQNNFHPYKLDNIEWQEVEATYESAGGTQYNDWYYNFYKLCGDTLYNGVMYKKVFYGYVYNQYQPLPPWMIPKSPPYYSFYCFFRQDSTTKSNYYRMPNWSTDSLLVSYDLNVGDTIKNGLYSATGNSGTYWTVQKKDSLFYAGQKLTIFYTDTAVPGPAIQYCKIPMNGMFLVEGLGQCYGIFYAHVIPFESGNMVDSISFNSTCDSMMIGLQQERENKGLCMYPNPCNEYFMIESDGPENLQMQLIDARGQLVMIKDISENSPVMTKDLPVGLYHVNLYSKGSLLKRRLVIIK